MNHKQSERQAGCLQRATNVLVLAGALTATACSSVQTTQGGTIGVDRKQMMSPLVSEQELQAGAVKAYTEVLTKEKSEGDLNADPAMRARVQAIAERIIPQTAAFRPDAPQWKWEVNVIQSEELNAWCMPGGKIAFYSGIITKLNLTDDEIAAIMGHEIAHALREHARERASEQATTGIVIGVGSALLGGGQAGSDLTQMAYHAVFGLKHSRLHETEADRIGVELAARGGFDPRASITLWEKMGKASSGKGGPEFLSTHPSAETRTADLREYSNRVMPLYEKSRRR